MAARVEEAGRSRTHLFTIPLFFMAAPPLGLVAQHIGHTAQVLQLDGQPVRDGKRLAVKLCPSLMHCSVRHAEEVSDSRNGIERASSRFT